MAKYFAVNVDSLYWFSISFTQDDSIRTEAFMKIKL